MANYERRAELIFNFFNIYSGRHLEQFYFECVLVFKIVLFSSLSKKPKISLLMLRFFHVLDPICPDELNFFGTQQSGIDSFYLVDYLVELVINWGQNRLDRICTTDCPALTRRTYERT